MCGLKWFNFTDFSDYNYSPFELTTTKTLIHSVYTLKSQISQFWGIIVIQKCKKTPINHLW